VVRFAWPVPDGQASSPSRRHRPQLRCPALFAAGLQADGDAVLDESTVKFGAVLLGARL